MLGRPGKEETLLMFTISLPDGSTRVIRLGVESIILIPKSSWPNANRARRYLRSVKESLEGRLGVALTVTIENGPTYYVLRWEPERYVSALSNT